MKRALAYVALLGALLPASTDARSVKVYLTSGTGFIVSRDGHIVTNEHVVKGCQRIIVSGAVNTQNAVLVGTSRTYDLALLKLDSGTSVVANLRSSSQPLEAGEDVVIVGYPGKAAREGRTVTKEAKIINPKGPQGEEKWVELSDVIEQGNSGGALLDTSGHVVGVVAAKATIYTYNKANPRAGTTRNSGIAVSLPTLKSFLQRYRVYFRQEESHADYSSHRVTDIAERFMVNVNCAYKTEVHR